MGTDDIQFNTNYLIRALVTGSAEEAQLLAWLGSRRPLSISAVAWAEFLCGPVSPSAAAAAADILGDPIPLGPQEARLAAHYFNAAGRRRGSLVDCLIAATAMTAGAALATVNVDDFRRLIPLGFRLAT